MAQTAVEWFADKIDDLISNELRERVELLKNQAKQMEKEQHKYTWHDSNSCISFDGYYTQIYNQTK